MILHEAPSMETTTPKGEWFPCWVAEWSIMENMQQQMWFCIYPSPISINISIYVYNALRLTPEIWFWAMPFASFQIDINKYFAIVSPRCQVISNCDVISPWITWQNNRLMISRFTIFSREYFPVNHSWFWIRYEGVLRKNVEGTSRSRQNRYILETSTTFWNSV